MDRDAPLFVPFTAEPFELEGPTPEELASDASIESEILTGAAFAGLTVAEQKALAITSTLETGHRGGFDGLSGDFDGMGLSFGLVNWNLGAGSLQPLLRDLAREFPTRFVAAFGLDAPRFLALITPTGDAARRTQLAFAKREMNEVRGGKKVIREPWSTYFRRLAADPEFQRIEVRYAKELLDRAKYFCEYFGLVSERALCFMFDAVSSHGKWWLTKKYDGVEKRRLLLRDKLARARVLRGGAAPDERQVLEAVAETLRDTSLAKWAERVYVRKMWFLTGKHPRAKELAGLEPTSAPYASSPAASTVRAPTPTPTSSPRTTSDAMLDSALVWAMFRGARTHEDLADAVFADRHPERRGARIGAHEAATIREWKAIAARAATLFPSFAKHELELELPGPVTEAVALPIVLAAIQRGIRDPSVLASEAFYAVNPERKRRPIAAGERDAAAQWRRLRDGVVTRALGLARVAVPPTGDEVAGGRTHYLALTLGDEGKAPGRTGIFVPEAQRRATDVDVILYLHGHKAGHYSKGESMGIDRYWSPRTTPQAPLREAIVRSGKAAILVAPTLGPTSQARALAKPGGLDGYLERVLAELGTLAPFSGARPRLRHLVLAAHSGGGIWMLRLATSGATAVRDHLRECWGFDCFYNPKLDVPGWTQWARAHPDRTLVAHHATDACKNGLCYGPNTVAAALAKAGLANLKMSPARRRDHFAALQDHFGERVAAGPFSSAAP